MSRSKHRGTHNWGYWPKDDRKIARKRWRAQVRLDLHHGRFERVESRRDRCYGWYW